MSPLNSPTSNLKHGLTLLLSTRAQKGGAPLQTVDLQRCKTQQKKQSVSETLEKHRRSDHRLLLPQFPRHVWKLAIDMIWWVTSGWSIISFHNSVLCTVKRLYIHHLQTSISMLYLPGLRTCFHSGCRFYARLEYYFVKKLPLHFSTTQTIFFPRISLKSKGKNKLH